VKRNCLSEGKLRASQESQEFCDLRFGTDQIIFSADLAPAELGIEISIGGLIPAFNCFRRAVQSALANGLNEPKSRGWHMAGDAESEANILAWMKPKDDKSAAVTRTDVRNYCLQVCKFQVSRGALDSFISLHADELTEKKSSPQEETRLQVPRVFLEETIGIMQERLHGRPFELVFNLAEVGISDWEDRRPKKVVAPITTRAHNIHHRASRNLKHISIVTCICASGG
jgi:hypothetical protein